MTLGGAATPLADAAITADRLTFAADGARYDVRVNGDTMTGTVTREGAAATPWRATRVQP
jgi:hypothetical protein